MLAIVAIGFSQRTQEQVNQTLALEDRTRAALKAESALQETLFFLLTESEPPENDSPCGELSGISKGPAFNRYGEPFCPTADLVLMIQDLSGLLPATYPGHPLWPRYLARRGMSDDELRAFLGLLGDLQDQDNQGYVRGTMEPKVLSSGRPFPNRLAQRPSLLHDIADDPSLYAALKQDTHLLGPVTFNPHFAPLRILEAVFEPGLAKIVAKQRREGSLTQATLENYATKLGDPEVWSFSRFNSSRYWITTTAFEGRAMVARSAVIELQQGMTPPFTVLSTTAP